MSVSPTRPSAYVLRYRSFDYFFIGVVVALLSAGMAAVAFTPVAVTTRNILLVVCVIGGFVAGFLLKTGLRYKQRKAWYLSFAPSRLCINFFDFSLASLPLEAAIMDIPRDDLVWIRKSRKQGLDESDKLFVDLRVSHRTWETAKRYRVDFRSHLDPFVTPHGTGTVQFFEEDIIRISVEGSTWPVDLADHWQQCDYPVVDDYEIGPKSTINLDPSDAHLPSGQGR